jgi:hypothetical protein
MFQVSDNTTMKETAIATLRSTATKAKGMGRTFGLIGAIYGSTECVIETVTTRPDKHRP